MTTKTYRQQLMSAARFINSNLQQYICQVAYVLFIRS